MHVSTVNVRIHFSNLVASVFGRLVVAATPVAVPGKITVHTVQGFPTMDFNEVATQQSNTNCAGVLMSVVNARSSSRRIWIMRGIYIVPHPKETS